MKRLYYFTDSYPFSVDYTWKSTEIKEAAKQFEEIVIVPFTHKKANEFTFPKNVRVCPPTLGDTLFAKPKYLRHLFASTQPQKWFLEFFKALKHGKQAVTDWYLATIYSNIIVNQPIFKELQMLQDKKDIVLFFQWTMNNALLIPLLHQWGYKTIICRMHGYDLYEFRHHNYLPYKAKMLKHATITTFISQHGRNYAQQRYPFIKTKSRIHYLGAKAMAKNKVNPEDKFHLLSVSRVVPLKRIVLIAKALKHIKTPVKWTHIGDGYAIDTLKNEIKRLKESNTKCEVSLLGWLAPEAITQYFSKVGINALILVSKTEGLPVVIMEAFSASIPVIATNVGGVSELVDEANGILLPSNPEVNEVAEAIERLANEPRKASQMRRNEAFKSYAKSFDLEKNTREFIDFLALQSEKS